jgi:CRP-like cAMP-binding protein
MNLLFGRGKHKIERIPSQFRPSTNFLQDPNQLKTEILSRVQNTMARKASIFGYGSDILSSLNEVNIPLNCYLELCIHCLTKPKRTIADLQLINGYLLFMDDFVSLIKKHDGVKLTDYLQQISMHLGYEKFKPFQLICKFGDKGKKAYIVLKGKIEILIKQAKQIAITQNEYLKYLGVLLKYQEYGLLSLVLKDNFDVFPIEIRPKEQHSENITNIQKQNPAIVQPILPEDPFSFTWVASETKNKGNAVYFTPNELLRIVQITSNQFWKQENIYKVTPEAYIERINIFEKYDDIIPNNENFKKVIVYGYARIVTKEQGSLIGEIALNDPFALRSATMIAVDDTHLGTINKHSYNLSLKSCTEKQRKQNIIFIQGFKLFSHIPICIFGKRYFNNFIFTRIQKGAKIIEEGIRDENLYVIKEGIYEVSMKGSLNDLNLLRDVFEEKLYKLKQQNYKPSSIQRIKENNYYYNLMKDNPQFETEFYKTKKIIIGEITSPDLVGLSDYKSLKHKCIFTIECKSARGELFVLNSVFFNELKKNDKTVLENQNEMLCNRLDKMYNRILLIFKSQFESFYDYKSKRTKFQLENDLKKDFETHERIKSLTKFEVKRNIIVDKIKSIQLLNNSLIVTNSNNTNNDQNQAEQKQHNKIKIVDCRLSRNKKLRLTDVSSNNISNVFLKSRINSEGLLKVKKADKITSSQKTRLLSFTESSYCNNNTQASFTKDDFINSFARTSRSLPPLKKIGLIEIELYTQLKKEKYLYQRNKYLMNQTKRFGIKLYKNKSLKLSASRKEIFRFGNIHIKSGMFS